MANTNSNELKEFIKQSNNRLKKLLKRLKWSQKETLKNFNTNSKAASTNNESCKITYSPKTTTFPDSCITQNSIVLATPKLQEVLRNPNAQAPHNFNELQRNFSREEKLKIYDYVIENTEKLPSNKELPGVEGELSIADILAQKKREDKRKKRKFRKTKPTHIEEVRCLVELQMQALQQYMGNKIDNQTPYTHTQGNFDYNNATNNTYYKDFYMKRNSYQNNERIAEQSNKYTEDFKGCYRIRNRYYGSERRRHERSRSRERKRRRSRSHDRYKDHSKNRRRSHSKDDRSRERRKRSHSRSRKRSHSRNDRSRERTKRSHSRSRKRSHSKDIRSKERTKRSRSRSCSNDYKYENKYSRRYSRSPESSKSKNYKQYYDVKYNEDEKHNKYKFCKHNKRKHKREYT